MYAPHFRKGLPDDPDFQIALWGLLSGKVYQGLQIPASKDIKLEAMNLMELKGMEEKADLNSHSMDPDQILSTFLVQGAAKKMEDEKHSFVRRTDIPEAASGKGIIWNTGKLLIRFGTKLKRFGN